MMRSWSELSQEEKNEVLVLLRGSHAHAVSAWRAEKRQDVRAAREYRRQQADWFARMTAIYSRVGQGGAR